MELRTLLAAWRAAWWLPVLGAITGAVVGLAISLLQTPLYTSTTQLFVAATGSVSASDALSGSQFSQQRVTSYSQLIMGNDLARRVIDRLKLSMTPDELAGEITATSSPDTVLIDVSVTDPSPRRARDIAAAVGTEFTALVGQLEPSTPSGTPLVKVSVTDPPEAATSPSRPQPVRNTALGLLAGLLVGAGTAVAKARLSRSVKEAEEAGELAGAPVIGVIVRDEALNKRHVIDRKHGNRAAEEFRQLRTNLQFLNVDQPPTVIMLSSAMPSEGKTTVAVNLALTLSDAGRTVTLVEADLRRPKLTKYLGMVGDVGLTNVLAGTADIADVLQVHGSGDLSVIASGPVPPNPGELLASSQMSSLIDKLRSQSDFVIIDAPPLLPVADSSGLAVQTDGVLLSVRHGVTRKEQVRQAATTLNGVGAHILGVILNIVPPKSATASTYGYGYSYGAGKHAD